jgi:NADPH:quinone reductase-like Zn-dependent oxidoreductase
MSQNTPRQGLQLRSLLKADGVLELSLAEVDVPAPGPDEVVVRIEGAPVNPSDLGLLLGPADLSTATESHVADLPVFTAIVPPQFMKMMAARVDESLPVGNEGAGVVVAAGASAQGLIGRTVAIFGGATYAQFKTVKAADCLVLPAGTTGAEGASCFVNPLTALGMVETMRREGHTALAHTAAASNLGQMLNRICLADAVPLVNIVRNPDQAALLRGIGAQYVCDSTASNFTEDLTAALEATGATLAFDAIGGGRLVSQILTAMEVAASKKADGYSRYGSTVHKQAYIYGGLDTGPTTLNRGFGMAWSVGGWLLPPFLAKIGPGASQALRERVARELKTTFASHYTAEISLIEALRPDIIAAYNRRATGEKYLINPSKV